MAVAQILGQTELGPALRTNKVMHGNAYLVLIDLLAILQKSLDRALSLYIFIRKVRLSGVRSSITIVHIRKFHKM